MDRATRRNENHHKCSKDEHSPWKLNTEICCTKTQCKKTFTSRETFERELGVYEMNLDYVPRLIEANPAEMSIVMENAGKPFGTTLTAAARHLIPPTLEKMLPDHRATHVDEVRAVYERFHADTGLHHNDVQYKNVLRHDNGKLYLIDFEHSTPTLRNDRCYGRSCWDLDGIFTK